MERSLLMIVVIVFVVAFVGTLTVWRPQDITGNVVLEPAVEVAAVQQVTNICDHCTGLPVCAVKDGIATDYENACLANCDGARVIYSKSCGQVPVITAK